MNGKYDETLCCCALNMIFGYEPKISKALLDTLGSASAVFGLDKDGLDAVFGPYSRHAAKITERALDEAERELSRVSDMGCRFIGLTGEDYPVLLKECEDAPAGLYVKAGQGVGAVLSSCNMIAVVGTRDVSPYGREWAGSIVTAISSTDSPPPIVSGLAFGVDCAAHRQALDEDIVTVAVMATGIDSVYPWRHKALAEEIAAEGALVTDFPLGTSPVKVNFLRRNRIIAGMCKAVIVVESRRKGGGMVTAGLASSYGRDLYALPGRADDVRSAGCNWLIRSKMAEAIYSCEDLVSGLGMKGYAAKRKRSPEEAVRTSFAGRVDVDRIGMLSSIISLIRRHRGITVDELSSLSGLPWREVRENVAMLECDGLVTVDLLQRCSINSSFPGH